MNHIGDDKVQEQFKFKLQPEDTILVLLPAQEIPDGATVSKRTGEVTYTLCHSLKLYQMQEAASPKVPVVVAGVFLVGSRGGSIDQVRGDQLLHWHVSAGELVEMLQESWEPVPQ